MKIVRMMPRRNNFAASTQQIFEEKTSRSLEPVEKINDPREDEDYTEGNINRRQIQSVSERDQMRSAYTESRAIDGGDSQA